MATDIRVPALGESVTEATIGQWFKKVGDMVAADEPVVELETDKVTIEVPAPSAGILQAISANPGDTVNVGALIGAIGEAAAAPAPKAPEPPKAAAPAAPAFKPEPAPPAQAANGAAPPPAPAAAKMMSENGVAASDVNGSGKHGQVLKEDVLSAMSRPVAPPAPIAPAPMVAAAAPSAASGSAVVAPRPAPAAAPTPAPAAAPRAPVAAADEGREERVRMTRLRLTIARRLKDAQNTAAMLTTFNEVDMKPIMELRAQYKD
ncbi:MAG: biotin/lipoyl-containing protein, partial [Devosia sp.]